jgi:hypothetical protein
MTQLPQPNSEPAAHLGAAVLAVLLPALILALGAWLLLAAEGQELSAAAQRMDERLAEAQPEVVVVGNSLVARGIDAALLAEGLDDGPVAVAKVFESGTWPANWYLFLKNRVYGQGYRPHAVVICMGPKVLFQTELGSELSRQSLGNHVTEHEPVVYRKVFGRETPNPLIQRLRDNRGAFQERWAAGLRAFSVGLFRGDRSLPLLERGEAVAAPALDAVFEADGAVDMSLHRRVIPVVEHERQVVLAGDSSVVHDSFVPDLLDLAEEHGSRLVFVRMPMLPDVEQRMSVDPAVEAEFVRLLNERGAAYVDMSGQDYPRRLFDDGAHLSQAGREHFSPLLAQQLRERGIMEQGPFRENRVPLALVPTVSLLGALPEPEPLELALDPDGAPCRHVAVTRRWAALGSSNLGAGGVPVSPLVVLEDGAPLQPESWPGKLKGACMGAFVPQSAQLFVSPGAQVDPPMEQRSYSLTLAHEMPVRSGQREGWFVYPGTRLELAFEGWQGPAAEVEILVGLEPLGDEAKGVSVVAMDRSVDLEPRGQRWLGGALRAPSPEGPWSIVIASPQDGPVLQIRWLAVRARGETLDLAGSEALMQPPVVSFMVIQSQATATVQGTPPRWELPLQKVNRAGVARAELEAVEELSNRGIGERMPCGQCSPLRVSEDGTLYPLPELFCGAVLEGSPSLSCHPKGAVVFSSSDGSDPLTNGRRYELALNPERQRGLFWWLYPGDQASIPLPTLRRRELRDGASRLHLEGTVLGPGEAGAGLRLLLRIGERVVLDERVPLAAFRGGPVDRTLPERYDLRGQQVTLELRSDPDAPYLFLTTLELGE